MTGPFTVLRWQLSSTIMICVISVLTPPDRPEQSNPKQREAIEPGLPTQQTARSLLQFQNY
jgi:hypothetical protein